MESKQANRHYVLRIGCCVLLPITLCEEHLKARSRDGWGLVQDKGPDSLPCYDCRYKVSDSDPIGQQK